jgi:hypothetical protein
MEYRRHYRKVSSSRLKRTTGAEPAKFSWTRNAERMNQLNMQLKSLSFKKIIKHATKGQKIYKRRLKVSMYYLCSSVRTL